MKMKLKKKMRYKKRYKKPLLLGEVSAIADGEVCLNKITFKIKMKYKKQGRTHRFAPTNSKPFQNIKT